MSHSVIRAAMVGAVKGILASTILFATSRKYTLSQDWFLAVMIISTMAVGWALAAKYQVNLLGMVVAGFLGLMVGGWAGQKWIGSYEYTVRTPREGRTVQIIAGGKTREVAVPGVPDQTVRHIPIGAGIGVLIGWLAGALVWTLISRQHPPGDDSDVGEEPE